MFRMLFRIVFELFIQFDIFSFYC